MTLSELKIGESAVVTAVGGEGILRRRLLDMGITPKTKLMVRKMAPLGDHPLQPAHRQQPACGQLPGGHCG